MINENQIRIEKGYSVGELLTALIKALRTCKWFRAERIDGSILSIDDRNKAIASINPIENGEYIAFWSVTTDEPFLFVTRISEVTAVHNIYIPNVGTIGFNIEFEKLKKHSWSLSPFLTVMFGEGMMFRSPDRRKPVRLGYKKEYRK